MLPMLFHQLIVSNLKVSLCTTAALFFFQFSAFGVGHYNVLRCFIVNVFLHKTTKNSSTVRSVLEKALRGKGN